MKLLYQVATGSEELKDVREYEQETELGDSIKNHPMDSSDDLINKTDVIKSTKERSTHNDLRQRSQAGVRSNSK